MKKLIKLILLTTLISSINISYAEDSDLMTPEETSRVTLEAYLLKYNERSFYQIALMRQAEEKISDRVCTFKINHVDGKSLVNPRAAIVCQFLLWHNLQLATNKITEEESKRFSESYFLKFVNLTQ